MCTPFSAKCKLLIVSKRRIFSGSLVATQRAVHVADCRIESSGRRRLLDAVYHSLLSPFSVGGGSTRDYQDQSGWLNPKTSQSNLRSHGASVSNTTTWSVPTKYSRIHGRSLSSLQSSVRSRQGNDIYSALILPIGSPSSRHCLLSRLKLFAKVILHKVGHSLDVSFSLTVEHVWDSACIQAGERRGFRHLRLPIQHRKSLCPAQR